MSSLGLREIGEIRVRLSVVGVDDAARCSDRADQALAHGHARAMHRLARQPLGGEELQHIASPECVDRADLGDQVGGYQLDDAIEPCLPLDGQRHHLDHAPEQLAGARELGAAPLRARLAASPRGRHR